MPRERKGSIVKRKDGSIFARVTYLDPVTQKRKDKLRRADNRTHAKEIIKEMLRDIDDNGEQSLDGHTFADLATYYKKHYLTKAEYVDGRKTTGLRSLAAPTGFLNTLCDYFGKRLLRKITYGDVRSFHAARIKAPTSRKTDKDGQPIGKRSVASVNRELALLRRVFNVAVGEGWIPKNPMHRGKSLVSIADEQKRERVLTFDEENKLLAACGKRTMTYTRNGKKITAIDNGGKRAHLRAIIIAAIDTGMRRGELLKLRWSDIDFANEIITVQALNTKTLKMREVGISTRLKLELETLFNQSPPDLNALVFGLNDVKRSFEGVRRAAGLPDVRFHDLRHTHATRLIACHIPVTEVARTLGHQQLATTFRYVNQTRDSTKRITDAIDAMRAGTAMQDAAEENSLIN